jgi:signal transduction histidine kinase
VASHDLALDVDVGDAPIAASVDAPRVEQVVSNLVGNAVKFTPAGGRVMVGCARVDGEARLTVRDTGVGIPAEQLPHVFGAFWQARHADRRGLGLGLAIARGIVEAHGGRIWVESRPGDGTTFTCAFPTRSEA